MFFLNTMTSAFFFRFLCRRRRRRFLDVAFFATLDGEVGKEGFPPRWHDPCRCRTVDILCQDRELYTLTSQVQNSVENDACEFKKNRMFRTDFGSKKWSVWVTGYPKGHLRATRESRCDLPTCSEPKMWPTAPADPDELVLVSRFKTQRYSQLHTM